MNLPGALATQVYEYLQTAECLEAIAIHPEHFIARVYDEYERMISTYGTSSIDALQRVIERVEERNSYADDYNENFVCKQLTVYNINAEIISHLTSKIGLQ